MDCIAINCFGAHILVITVPDGDYYYLAAQIARSLACSGSRLRVAEK